MNFESILKAVKHRLLHLLGRTPEQRWNKNLDEIVREFDESQKNNVKTLINNYHRSAEQGHGDLGHSGNRDYKLDTSMIAVQLAALKRMRVMNLVGFQAMTGPVNKVFSLQTKKEEFDPSSTLLTVVDGIVEAKRHELSLRWPVEMIMDNELLYGDDSIRPEVELASANELALECDNVVINDIKSVASKVDAAHIDSWQELSITINKMANGIAERSRRGRGNWAIVPFNMIDMLEENPSYLHFPEGGNIGLNLMGELLPHPDAENGIKIYSDVSHCDNTILVGFKGISDIDTGYIYSPYILAVPSGIITDPESFQPRMAFVNRGGSYVYNPEDYYTLAGVTR